MESKILADFTAQLNYDLLTAHSVEMAKKTILDWLGVAIRGSQEPPAKLIRKTILAHDCGKITVLGEKQQASVLNAAFSNGAASHTLDFDDLHNASIIHLATVVIPGVFALAEANHKSGKEMIAAVCAGYEAGARAGEAVIPESYFFWHTTGTAGTFGAAAAAANIINLTPEQTLMCYGSAGTQTAGLWEFLKEGAMSKALHAGKSSYAGVLSALLARDGFTGATQILEGEKGFCRAMVKEPHLEKLTENLDYKNLKIDVNAFKSYPCCKHSHAALYAIQSLVKEHNLKESEIAQVNLYVNNITDYLINNDAPQTAYGCKFSLQYCAAAMLWYRKVSIEQFSEKAISDADVRRVMKKIKIIKSEAMETVHNSNPDKLASEVELVLTDGQKFTLEIDYPKGDPANPFSWEDAKAKFMPLASAVYDEAVAEKLYQLIRNLETIEDFTSALTQCFEV